MALMDILGRYWWVFGGIAGLLLVWVWFKLDLYTKRTVKKALSGKAFLIIAFVIIWIIWHRFGATLTLEKSDFYMPFIGLLYLLALSFMGKLRYETQQFETPNFHGSYSKNPYKVDGFYIFAIDSFNSGGISWDYADRIAIVREETVELLREGAFSIAMMSHMNKYEIPVNVKQFIESNKFLKRASNQVFYGWFDDIERVDWEFDQLKKLADDKKEKVLYNLIKKELNVDNPKISTLLWLYKNQNQAVNKQTEYYDATIDSVEKGVEHQKRVKDAYSPNKDEYKTEGFEEG